MFKTRRDSRLEVEEDGQEVSNLLGRSVASVASSTNGGDENAQCGCDGSVMHSQTLDGESLVLRVFRKTSKHF